MKKVVLWGSILLMTIAMTIPAYAGGRLPNYSFADPELEGFVGGWGQDSKGWRYYVNAEKTEWLASVGASQASAWIDSDHDGIYQKFTFDHDGYISINKDYGGYGYDSTGARFDNNVVGTRTKDEIIAMKVEKDARTAESERYNASVRAWLKENNSYNADGFSNVSIDMLNITRTENAEKYGIYREDEYYDYWMVKYNNGFTATYYKEGKTGEWLHTDYAADLMTLFPSSVLKGLDEKITNNDKMNSHLMDQGYNMFDKDRTGVVNVMAVSDLYVASWYDFGRMDIQYKSSVTPPYLGR